MKTTLVLVAVLGLAFGAPAENISSEMKAEVLRAERSFGSPPCAAAGGYSSPGGYAPAPQYLPPLAPPLSPLPQYREEEKPQASNARSYYEPSLPALPIVESYGSGSASVLGPAPSPAHGPAVGLFPSAKVGGCNVPLLLSCSPQVVTGHLTETHYSAPAYKNAEAKWDMPDTKPSNARVASHHKVSEDYPEPVEPHPGNHHVISKDYPEPNLVVYVPREENKKEIKNN